MALFNSAEIAEHYFRSQIETASKRKAICMLHERCMFFLIKTFLTNKEKSFLLIKAQNILSQLQRSLRIHDSVSRSLFYLYDYCYLCLERGGDQDINNTLELIGILRDTFRKLSKRP
jgi:flagellin-specific chaperone FliS